MFLRNTYEHGYNTELVLNIWMLCHTVCEVASSLLVTLRNPDVIDLKIGEEGFPKYVVVGGDQQTYAHMGNLN